MKFLLVSKDKENECIVSRLNKEGNDAKLLCAIPAESDFTAPAHAEEWAPEILFFENPGLGKVAKEFSDRKYSVFNGSLFHDLINTDVALATSIMQRGCKNALPTIFTNEPSEAVAFLMRHSGEFETTIDSEEKVYNKTLWTLNGGEALEAEVQMGRVKREPTLLQRFYPNSLEFSFVAFYNEGGLVPPVLLMGEEFGLLKHGGVRSPEGCILYSLPVKSKFNELIFNNLALVLTSLNYVGPVVVDAVLTSPNSNSTAQQFFIKRIKTRLPSGFWQGFMEGLDQDLSLFVKSLVDNKKFYYRFTNDVVTSQRISVSPYPYRQEASVKPSDSLKGLINYPTYLNGVYSKASLGYRVMKTDYKSFLAGCQKDKLESQFCSCLTELPELQYKVDFGEAHIQDTILFDLISEEKKEQSHAN